MLRYTFLSITTDWKVVALKQIFILNDKKPVSTEPYGTVQYVLIDTL